MIDEGVAVLGALIFFRQGQFLRRREQAKAGRLQQSPLTLPSSVGGPQARWRWQPLSMLEVPQTPVAVKGIPTFGHSAVQVLLCTHVADPPRLALRQDGHEPIGVDLFVVTQAVRMEPVIAVVALDGKRRIRRHRPVSSRRFRPRHLAHVARSFRRQWLSTLRVAEVRRRVVRVLILRR